MNTLILLSIVGVHVPVMLFIPLIPPIVIAGGPLLILLWLWYRKHVEGMFKKGVYQYKMAVLGMTQSGKTTWYNFLRGNEVTESYQTASYEIDAFDFTIDGRTITIAKGRDINGTEENVGMYYESLIKNNDTVMFFFDAAKYIKALDAVKQYKKDETSVKAEDYAYVRFTNARLRYIQNQLPEDRTFYTILSHTDLIKSSGTTKDPINTIKKELIRLKIYGVEAVDKYVISANMTNDKDIENIKQCIFKEKK